MTRDLDGRHLLSSMPVRADDDDEDRTYMGFVLGSADFLPPQINLINSFASQNALKEGDRTTFKCTIMSNPMVQEIKWYFEGREVSKLFPDESINNDTMTLKSVSRRHIGRYWCSASNLEGRRSSNKIKLMIQYVPSCNVPRQTISVSLNQEARPTCIVKADPQEVTFSWIFNNSKESFEIMSYSENGLTSIATFVPQNRNQFGWLSCKARNSVGIQRDACIFVLKEAGPPAKLENCMVLNRTSTSIHVKCKPGHDGGMLQRFQMEVYEKWLHTPTVNVTSIDLPRIVHIFRLGIGLDFIHMVFPKIPSFNLMKVCQETGIAEDYPLYYPETCLSVESSYIMPLVGIVIGVLASLLAIAICIVVMHTNQRNQIQCDTIKQISEERDPDIIPYLSSIEHSIDRRKPNENKLYTDSISNITTDNDDLLEYASCSVKAVSQSSLDRNTTPKPRLKHDFSKNNRKENVTFAELSIPLVENRTLSRKGQGGNINNHVHFADPHEKPIVRELGDDERYPVTAETPLMECSATESAV
ncbi:Tyrosine-protein kinase receptor TYRO3 [Nymphon striatum]|nr:Tyrosine-protein kinase receptor TYRO3 [Nymphon striatum]